MANLKAKCSTNHLKKETHHGILLIASQLKPQTMTHELRVSAGPLLPPELPDQ